MTVRRDGMVTTPFSVTMPSHFINAPFCNKTFIPSDDEDRKP
ncbi:MULTISPECIES: hypothetical protein [Bacteroides]|nr:MULTISPECIES: hypothetical protein [Bacteroides]